MENLNDQQSGLLTVGETASFFRLKESTIRDWILRRKITYVKLGGRVFVRKTDAQKLIDTSIVPALLKSDDLEITNAENKGAPII